MGGSIVGEVPSGGTVLGRALSGGAVLGGLSVFIKNLTGSVPLYYSVYNKLSADCARVRLCVRMYCTLHWGQSGLLQRYVPQRFWLKFQKVSFADKSDSNYNTL